MPEVRPEPWRDLDKIISQLSDTTSKGATNPDLYLECGKACLEKAQMLSRRQADRSWSAYEFFEKAHLAFSRGLELDPASSELLYYHGLSLIELNQFMYWPSWSEAISDLEKASQLDPEKGYILVGLARAYLGRSGLDRMLSYDGARRAKLNPWFIRAQTTLEKAVQQEPGLSRAHRILGNLYYLQRDYRRAFMEYDLALKLGPSDPEDYERLSFGYMESGLEAFWDDINWIPSFIKIPALLPAILFVAPEKQMDMQLLQRAAALDSSYALPLRELAVKCMQNGRIESAAEYYVKFRQIDQLSSSNLLTASYNVNYPYEKLFQTAIRLHPEFYVPYQDLGNYYFRFAVPPDTEKAIVQYLKATQLNQRAAYSYEALGLIHRRRGDSTKAREFTRQALSTYDSTVWSEVLEDYLAMDPPEDAVKLLERSTKSRLRKSLGYLEIAGRYLVKGNIRRAEEYYYKSLAESNLNVWAEEELGRISARKKNKEYTALIGCEIRAVNGFTIGVVTPETSNPGSLLKTDRFDSQDTLVSRYNSLSEYGGPDGAMSPFNPRCAKPPKIMRGNAFVAYLSDNPAIKPRISATRLIGFLKGLNEQKNNKSPL